MKAYLFVDGNNCLHTLFPLLPLEVARERLLNVLTNLAIEKDLEIKVFFDQPSAERIIERSSGVTLFFPKRGESADKLIEEEILRLSTGRYFYLVTSDKALRALAQLRKVICLNPDQLLSLQRRKKEKSSINKTPCKIADRISKETLQKLKELKNRKGS